MSAGDWLVYYSPKTDFPDGEPVRAFTALGRIVGDTVYAFDMGGPCRRDVTYVKGVREVPVSSLASELSFIKSHPNWGMLAWRGHFEIEMADLDRIAAAMSTRIDSRR